jgi:hypothetical protein
METVLANHDDRLVVTGNLRPDIENIRLGKRRERIKRSSFGQTPAIFHRLNLTAGLSAVDKLAALGLSITFLGMSGQRPAEYVCNARIAARKRLLMSVSRSGGAFNCMTGSPFSLSP